MHKSLTILLPIHNAQGTLARQITTLLDFLPEIRKVFDQSVMDYVYTEEPRGEWSDEEQVTKLLLTRLDSF